MFTVYARNINAIPPNQNPPIGEVEIAHIPIQEGEDQHFVSAVVENDMTNSGNFEFSVLPTDIYADIWRQMRTLVRVEYDGTTIFYGRVLTIDRDMFRTRKVHCEGAYSFFMDSVFEAKKSGSKITAGAYIDMLLEAHNNCMGDFPEKKIYRGEVPGHYSNSILDEQKIKNDTQKFAVGNGYKDVKSYLDELVSDYGGHMRVRYNDSDGKLYLDWLQTYFNQNENNQVMSVSSNAVDLSDTTEVNNIFTHVIIMGKGFGYSDGSSGGGKNHSITVSADPVHGGAAHASLTQAKPGEVIYLTANPSGTDVYDPESGTYKSWSFSEWIVNSGGVEIENNQFTMGSQNVMITAKFTNSGGGHAGHGYKISVVSSPSLFGSAWADRATAGSWDVVKLTAKPTEGHVFTRWVALSEGVVWINDNSFHMPSHAVTIRAVFDIE